MMQRDINTQKECMENGYPEHRIYMDGTAYCYRKGAMGQDEVMRIK
jgi:hypothetical protein